MRVEFLLWSKAKAAWFLQDIFVFPSSVSRCVSEVLQVISCADEFQYGKLIRAHLAGLPTEPSFVYSFYRRSLTPRPRAFLVTVSRQQRGGEEPPVFSLSTPGNNSHSRLCVSNQLRNVRNVWARFHRRVLSGSLESHAALTTPALLFIHYSCKSVFFFSLFLLSPSLCSLSDIVFAKLKHSVPLV